MSTARLRKAFCAAFTFVFALNVTSTAWAQQAEQAAARRHLEQALTQAVGRQVDLPGEEAVTSRPALKASTQIVTGLLFGVSGLAVAHALRPTLVVRGDLASTLVATSGNGRFLAIVLEDAQVAIWDLEQGRELARLKPAGAIRTLAVSNSGTWVVAAMQDGAVVKLGLGGGAPIVRDARATTLALSPDDQQVAIASPDGRVRTMAIDATKVLSDVAGPTRVVGLSFSHGRLLTLFADGEIRSDASLLPPVGRMRLKTASFREDGALAVAVDEDGALLRIDLGTGKSSAIGSGRGKVGVTFAGKDAILATNPAGDAELLDLKDGARLGRLVMSRDGWAVLDEAGRFDGSVRGLEAVSWTADGATFELNAFAKAYFEPGTLTNILSLRGPASPAAAKTGADLKPPPRVTVVLPADQPAEGGKPYQVVVLAEDQGGGVDIVRLYHNGKATDPGALLQVQDYQHGGRSIRAAVYSVTPTAGLNTFRAVADAQGGAEGSSARTSAIFTGSRQPSTLRILTVGVNTYASPLPPLALAVADASAVGDAFKAPSPAFAAVKETRLLNETATRASILAALQAVAEESTAADTVVIFLAGHGFSIDKDEWRFGGVDARADDIDQLRTTSISAAELQTWLVKTKASKIVLAIDACQSAAAFGPFVTQRSLFARLLADLGRTTGVVVYAAAQEGASSYEVGELGHGVFTYNLLQAVNAAPGDKGLTAFQLADYLEQSVPLTAQRFKTGRQDTAVFRLGVDFRLR